MLSVRVRRALDMSAVALFCVSVWLLFVSLTAAGAAMVLAMVLVIISGLIGRVTRPSDCGYADTVFGRGGDVLTLPSQRRPVWPNEAGAPE